MLEGTWTSATLTTALAPISSAPTARQEASSRRLGRSTAAPRRQLRKASMARPANPKRAPALRKGGIVSTTTRMARYVEPQTRYTIHSPVHTCHAGAAGAPERGAPAAGVRGGGVVVALTGMQRRRAWAREHQCDGAPPSVQMTVLWGRYKLR